MTSGLVANQTKHKSDFSSRIDWFIPQEVHSGDGRRLSRARLFVVTGWMIAALATVYTPVFFSMGSQIGGFSLTLGAVGAAASVCILRFSRSMPFAGSVLLAVYGSVLFVLSIRHGGIEASALPWYSAIPAFALCTFGRRVATMCLGLVLTVVVSIYAVQASGYVFPFDISAQHNQILWALSITGFTFLLLGLATHYESTKRQLHQSRVEAEAASRAKSEFLANMSHEIRTPMTAILGYADMLDQEDEIANNPELVANSVHTIRSNARHLLAIINDILDLSKIEVGKMTVESIPTNPVQIVEEVVSLLQPRAKGKGIHLKIHYDSPMPKTILSDPTRLRQILLNLAGNAIKFTEVGTVAIHTELDSEQNQLRFRIVDDGIGMTEEQQRLVTRFDAFTQADSSLTRKFGGTGLGLRISNSFAEMLGGEISVESEFGKGSAFTVTVATGALDGTELVQLPQHPPSETEMLGPSKEASKPDRPLSGMRILVAEDGPDNQRLIQFILKKAGADVTLAENGRIAVDQVEAARGDSKQFDIVLMDMQMPELDGYEATTELRNKGYEMPVIALTAHAMSGDREKCLSAGCDDYATKPIDREKLIEVVQCHRDHALAASR